jgi:hypothetical protein
LQLPPVQAMRAGQSHSGLAMQNQQQAHALCTLGDGGQIGQHFAAAPFTNRNAAALARRARC